MSADQSHETYLVRLWMMNTEESYWHALGLAQDVASSEDDDRLREHRLAEELSDWHEASVPDGVEGVWRDLFMLTMQRIDWIKLARELLTDVEDGS